MTSTYDLTTLIGKVRLLIQDTDTDDPVYTDEELQTFLTLESNNIYGAASQCLLAIGNSKARLAKWSLEGYMDSEAAATQQLRTQAAQYREMANQNAKPSDSFDVVKKGVLRG